MTTGQSSRAGRRTGRTVERTREEAGGAGSERTSQRRPPQVRAAAVTDRASVEAFDPEWGVVELVFEMDRDVARTVSWVAEEASVERAGYLASVLRHECRLASERDELRVAFSLTYHDEGWRTWLSDLADEATPYFAEHRRGHLDEFGDLIGRLYGE